MNKLRHFSYKFDKGGGPLSKKLLQGKITSGNCRLAVQDYFFSVHNLYLKPKDILLPFAYHKVGCFVDLFDQAGDIIYAEKLRDNKSFKNEDERILHFHTAIFLGKLNKTILSSLPFKSNIKTGTLVVWHASCIANGTDIWPVEKFLNYYRVVAAKRVLHCGIF